jgi:hypothetical protein
MKKKIILLALLTITLFLTPQPVNAMDSVTAIEAPIPLCLPNVFREVPENCQPSGPSEYFSRMTESGITFPIPRLPSRPLDAGWSELPFYYAKGADNSIPVYSSIQDAISKTNARYQIDRGFVYVSYIDLATSGQGKYYMIDQGVYVRGGDTAGRVTPSDFVGLHFAGTPKRQFGWVLIAIESQVKPGLFDPQYTGRTLYRYDLIQVFDMLEVDGVNWYLIGPDEWIESRYTSLVYPTDSPPGDVNNGRWIEINLHEQTLSVYENNHLIFATLVSTGIDSWWTRPGLFQITEKLESTSMSGAFEADRSDYYYLEDVPWTMYFDEKRALHGTYWHNNFGYQRSHGCANLSSGDSNWLYQWSQVGDYVYVWDASGRTPTDPSLYTAGGA